MNEHEIQSELEAIKRILESKANEIQQQTLLKDLDARRTDWERRWALFVPSKQRLERGGKTLELGENYEAIKDLRVLRDKNKIRQASLRDEMTVARTDLHNAEEALNLIEGEYRQKLAEQTKLINTIQKVKVLDEQLRDRQEAAVQVRNDYEESERELKECLARVEKEQVDLEKVELALRETRKFLQLHAIDEKLQTGLAGIQKCFGMYEQAEEKRINLKSSWEKSIKRRQGAQGVLNDRAALFSDVSHRFSVLEKSFTRARAFFESTLKGKSIREWREICDKNTKRLAELDELYKKFQEVKELETKLKDLQETKLKIQQETRNLNLRDVEQAGKIHELQNEAERLEKRVSLLNKINDLEAVRELLQDGIPCPLCGSLSHPYTVGINVPDPEEVHKQLQDTQKALKELREELSIRQTRSKQLSEENSTIAHDETDLRKKINELNSEISSKVSLLGLRLGTGIPPFEEIDRARQQTRDALQLARNAADTAEAAERDMKAAKDELDKIIETRGEVTHFHQDALFSLQNSKSEEEQLENEYKTQEEIVTSLKRELIAQTMPYGYKNLPDKNPVTIIQALEKRMNDWQENSRRSIELEHELSAANTRMTNIKKTRESLKLKRDDLSSRVKAVEAERDSIQQQRIILFEARKPDDEDARMNKNVEELRAKLNERREQKNDYAQKLDKILMAIHGVETDMARGREELQKHEIDFGKKLLALGFRNEDDYAAACLTVDERRDLQNRLRELTQEELEINAERENARAKLLDIQTSSKEFNSDELIKRTKILRNENLTGFEIVPDIKTLMLTCGLPEVL